MATEKILTFDEAGNAKRMKVRIARFLDSEPVTGADKENIRDSLGVSPDATGLVRDDIGSGAGEISVNGMLGSLAFQDADSVSVGTLEADGVTTLTNTGDNGLRVQVTDGNPMFVNCIGSAQNYLFDVRDDGTSKFRVDGSGNVGISNSSPDHPLTLTANTGAANTPVAWLHNSGNVSEYDGTVISTVNDGSDVEVLHVRTNTTTYNGGSSLMLVRGDGNVGVGTASPGAGLHLEQASTDNVLAIVGQDGYNGTLFLAADGSGKDAYINVGGNRNLQIDFDTSSTPAATGTNKFTFSKLGNFTVNDGRLEVQKTGGDAILSLNRTDAKQFNVYVDSNSDLNVRDQSAGSTRLKITGSGDVNVGAGNLVIGTSGKGIDFGSGASTTLSDYERGFHNATLTPITSGTITVDSSSDRLEYTRVGDLVTISGKLAVSAVSSPVGDFVKMSLPLAVASLTESAGHFAGSCEIFNTAGTLGGYSLIGIDGEAFVRIYKNTSSGAVATAPDFSGDEIVYVGFTYHTDA